MRPRTSSWWNAVILSVFLCLVSFGCTGLGAVRGLSGCGQRGPLCTGSRHRARARWFLLLHSAGSRPWARWLWHIRLVTPCPVESFWAKDGSRVGRWTLNHQTSGNPRMSSFKGSSCGSLGLGKYFHWLDKFGQHGCRYTGHSEGRWGGQGVEKSVLCLMPKAQLSGWIESQRQEFWVK